MARRAGRKRKAGRRQADGRLARDNKPVRAIDDRVRASRQPHRRGLKQADRLDERAAEPLGRLLLKGFLQGYDADSTAAKLRYDAGVMYAQIVGAYRGIIGTPRGLAGSGRGLRDCAQLCAAAHELLSAEQRAAVHDGLFDAEVCPCLGRKERYDAAFEALARCGRRAQLAVNAVAVHGEPIAAQDLVYLVAGLDALKRHFGLTPRRGREQHRNAH